MTALAAAMPAMLLHEGEWEGTYRHVSHDFVVTDEHRTWTRCEFPASGPVAYVQHNRLEWANGRRAQWRFDGVFDGEMLRWDTERLVGYGWETHGIVMPRLDRRDISDAYDTEMIELPVDGRSHAGTWQWFEGGVPTGRTLCDERRVG